MKTSKPITPVGYQTPQFMVKYLENLRSKHIIDFWYFIQHKGEEGEKDHLHVLMQPNGCVDTNDFWSLAEQYVEGEDKPRKFLKPCVGKVTEWILYCTHDVEFLEGERKEYTYGETQFYSWDSDDFHNEYVEAFHSEVYYKKSTGYRISKGETLAKLFDDNRIKITSAPQTLAFVKLAHAMREENELEEKYNAQFRQDILARDI